VADIEPYENTLSLDELRREVRDAWNQSHALNNALLELPEVPPIDAIRAITHAGMNSRNIGAWERGKEIQRKHEWGVVPSKTEYECAVGLWSVIREAIIAARDLQKSEVK
jgi:hypothetical protein